MRMRMWQWILVVMAVVLTACSSKTNTLNVKMNEFSFTPKELTVTAGSPVTINLKNTGALEHDFLILQGGEAIHLPFKEDHAKIYWKTHLDARQEQVLQFMAPSQPGEYRVVCGVPGHLEQKMQATLTVMP